MLIGPRAVPLPTDSLRQLCSATFQSRRVELRRELFVAPHLLGAARVTDAEIASYFEGPTIDFSSEFDRKSFALPGPRSVALSVIATHLSAAMHPCEKIQACGRCSRFLIGLHSQTAAGVSPLRL